MGLSGQTPPLSPVLLAGLAIRPLPPVLLQPIVDVAMAAMRRRYSEVFARLAPLADAAFLIDPVDLPFSFLLRPGGRPPGLTVVRDGEADAEAAATIRGPLLALIDLLEGRVDGDALFFSRDLVIEGDTEAVVTLRNVVDGAEIDFVEVMASPLGPLSGVVRRLAAPAGAVFRRMARDLDDIQAALIAPATSRCDALAADLREIRDRVDGIHRPAPRADVKAGRRDGGAGR
ncbi:MAG: SCP2 domain-containing protein [Kiloniellaceae bacterium]